jgi:hypothetical protein
MLTLNDSLELDLGTPKAPSVSGSFTPARLPIAVALSPASLSALAQARDAEVTLDTVRVRARTQELAEMNAFYRAARCGTFTKAH